MAKAANTRLTNDMRDAIVMRAIKAAYDPREQEFAKVEDGLAREAYAEVYTEEERKQAQKLPKNWLRRDPCLNYNVGGFRIKLTTLSDHFPVPYETRNGGYGYHCHADHGTIASGDLCDRIREHATALEALRNERKETQTRLHLMLSSISSLKKLREVWPEGEEFYARYEVQPVALPPAIRMDEINAALGLVAA